MRKFTIALAVPIALAALCSVSVKATSVRQMALPELVDRADRILRGTVMAADEQTVTVGGGSLPIVIYRVRVDQVLKGREAGAETIEVRLLAPSKPDSRGSLQRATLLRDLPQFSVGGVYLLMLTRPSAIGLSTTVGLGQGLFELRGTRGREVAVNQVNNVGLFGNGGPAARQAPGAAAQRATERSGPVSYSVLANAIRAQVGR